MSLLGLKKAQEGHKVNEFFLGECAPTAHPHAPGTSLSSEDATWFGEEAFYLHITPGD